MNKNIVPRRSRPNVMKFLGVMIAAACSCLDAQSAEVTSDWEGGDNGIYNWSDAANWSSAVHPNNGGGDSFTVNIGSAAGNRVITTSGELTVTALNFIQNTPDGSTTLRLGGNFTALGGVTTGSPRSSLVIDLNGYQFAAPGTTVAQGWTRGAAASYTLESSVAGGVFRAPRFFDNPSVTVGSGVTVHVGGNEPLVNQLTNFTWADGSTLLVGGRSTNSIRNTHTVAASLANVIVGDAATTDVAVFNLDNNNARVRGGFTLKLNSSETNASSLSIDSSRTLYLGGDFIDEATASAASQTYGAGTIVFNGSPGIARLVSTGRSGLENHFRVGEAAGTAGNIRLDQNLSTSASFTVQGNSRLDLGGKTLSSGSFIAEEDATFAFNLSSTGEQVTAINLTLNGFNLELSDSGGWINGDDLLLFSYVDSLTGTPDLLGLISSDDITHGGLVWDQANQLVYLSNVSVIPEPHSLMLLLVTGAGLLWKRQKRSSEKQA